VGRTFLSAERQRQTGMSAPRTYHAHMTPTELFEEARLAESIAAQEGVVRTHPDDPADRLLLCEFLAFAGDRDGVRRQLDVLAGHLQLAEYIAGWRQLLAADDARHAGARPAFLIDPPENVLLRLGAEPDDAIDRLDTSDESAAWLTGFVDGREFDGWRDADDALAPVVEAFVGDQYVWLPLEQVRKLRLDPTEVLRDNLYRPARVWLLDGSELEVIIPVLYVGTAEHPEEGIKTGAGIDWVERNGLVRGLGSRTFLFGDEELTLDEFRQVEVRG